MWEPEDVARELIQNTAAGKSLGEVRQTMAAEQESGAEPTAARARAAQAARRAEWRRIIVLMTARQMDTYRVADDPHAVEWAADRAARMTAAKQARRDAADELHAEVWLNAATSRRGRAVAAQHGVSVEQLLCHLADRVQSAPDEALYVEPFHPWTVPAGRVA